MTRFNFDRYGEAHPIEEPNMTDKSEAEVLAQVARANCATFSVIAPEWATKVALAVAAKVREIDATRRAYDVDTAYWIGAWDGKYGRPHGHGRTMHPVPDAAKQTPPDDGWIKWDGGECPVDPDTVVEVRCRGMDRVPYAARAFRWRWDGPHTARVADIIAYRLVTPAPAKDEPGTFSPYLTPEDRRVLDAVKEWAASDAPDDMTPANHLASLILTALKEPK